MQRPLTDRALKLRLALGARVVAARRELLRVQDDLRFHATHDGLTGTWNKNAIVGCVYREIARAVREASDVAVLMCDLDHFKAVNDVHGHPIGDDVLRGVAARVQTVLRPYDFVGRYGGEEFLVVLPGCDGAYARDVAERIRAQVGQSPIVCGNMRVAMTCSIGLVTLSELSKPDVAPDPADMLDSADQLLYRAKALGRDRVVSAQDLPRTSEDASQNLVR
jgi:diguanylate cyclase (GGDEF)-like protein